VQLRRTALLLMVPILLPVLLGAVIAWQAVWQAIYFDRGINSYRNRKAANE
jgi:hypothetical protein